MTALRLKKPYRIWSSGHVILNMPPNQAEALIRRGVAEEIVKTPPVEQKKPAFAAPVDRSIRATQMKLKTR